MRRKLVAAALLLVAAALGAEVVTFGSHFRAPTALDSFNIDYYPSKSMAMLYPPRMGVELPVHRAYSVDKGRYEVWYTLFADCGTGEKTRMAEYVFFMLNCASLAAGREITLAQMGGYSADDVAQVFNASYGHTCFVTLPNSAYARGYAYMLLNFFCKEGEGIVMRAFLTNDKAALTAPAKSFEAAFTSFKFKGGAGGGNSGQKPQDSPNPRSGTPKYSDPVKTVPPYGM